MKFIKFKLGRGVFHIVDPLQTTYVHYTYCGGNWATYNDLVTDEVPSGRLCPKCKKKYLRNHSEEDLLLELL